MAEVMDEMMEEECDIITLVDMDGKDVDFYHVATIDYKDKWYIFLQPVELIDGIAEDEVIIYELGVDEDGDDKFIPIEDENLLNEVFNEYLKEAEEEGLRLRLQWLQAWRRRLIKKQILGKLSQIRG